MKGIDGINEEKEIFYIKDNIVNIISFLDQNKSQKLWMKDKKSTICFELTVNTNNQLCYFIDTNNKKLIDINNADYILTPDSKEILEAFLNFKPEEETANEVIEKGRINNRQLLSDIYDAITMPRPVEQKEPTPEKVKVIETVRKTSFKVDLMNDPNVSLDKIAEKYLNEIFNGLAELIKTSDIKNPPRKVMTAGQILNHKAVQSEVNKYLTANSVKFSYQGRAGDGKLFRTLIAWIDDPKHPMFASF